MSITKLQATDLPGDALFGALVTKVNEVITASNATVDVTANTIPKGDATGLVNSSITDDGTAVTVTGALSVTGNTVLGNATTDTVAIAAETTSLTAADANILASGNLYIKAANAGTLYISPGLATTVNICAAGGTGPGATVVGGSLTVTGNATLGSAASSEVSVASGATSKIGFYGTSPITIPTVAGTIITATCGTGLRSLLNALDALGLINDTTSDI